MMRTIIAGVRRAAAEQGATAGQAGREPSQEAARPPKQPV
jgi:hypothetical protein